MITLTLDNQLIEEAQIIGEKQTPLDAVVEALEEYIQHRKQLQIRSLFNTIDYDDGHNGNEQRQKT